jgi:hypothetical protein
MAIKKHEGINQRTGRLKKGYRYNEKGNIVKAKAATAKPKRKTATKKKK